MLAVPHPARPPRALLPRLGALVLPWAALTSCSSNAGRHLAPIDAEQRIGVVRAIGPDERFVLVETASALVTANISAGVLLHCRAPDAVTHIATADLRVSCERQGSFLVANVLAGNPTLGAVVYFVPAASAPAAPAPAPFSSAPTAPLPGLFTPPQP